MDHVAALVALHAASGALTPSDISAAARLTPAVTEAVLADLVRSRLAIADGAAFRVDAGSPHAHAATQVVELYHAKPVTLVRAVYDRPSDAARSFADAFRVRKPGE
jgi:hypothetical protein